MYPVGSSDYNPFLQPLSPGAGVKSRRAAEPQNQRPEQPLPVPVAQAVATKKTRIDRISLPARSTDGPDYQPTGRGQQAVEAYRAELYAEDRDYYSSAIGIDVYA